VNLEQAVQAVIAQLTAPIRDRFAGDPLGVLRDDLHLTVRAADHLTSSRADGGACDGMSFLRDGVILFAPSPLSRRQNFTLAHELGHWLVSQSETVFDWVGDQEDAPRILETLCDGVAQQLLLPESSVDTVLSSREPVRAGQVLELYSASQASRPVCAIALARRLPGLGAVAIIDRGTATVTCASVRPEPEAGWPVVFPWPGQPVPSGHPFVAMTSGSTFTRRSFWRDQWNRRDDFYIDAVVDGPRLLAVFSATDLWQAEALHLDGPREFDQRPTTEIRCCGETRAVRGWPCATCGEPYCPKCGSCRCERQARREQACSRCFLRYQPHLLIDGLCEDCR
jgi:hypothetical protein